MTESPVQLSVKREQRPDSNDMTHEIIKVIKAIYQHLELLSNPLHYFETLRKQDLLAMISLHDIAPKNGHRHVRLFPMKAHVLLIKAVSANDTF